MADKITPLSEQISRLHQEMSRLRQGWRTKWAETLKVNGQFEQTASSTFEDLFRQWFKLREKLYSGYPYLSEEEMEADILQLGKLSNSIDSLVNHIRGIV